MRYIVLIFLFGTLTSFNVNTLTVVNKPTVVSSEYSVNQFYVKQDLESGTLNEDGDDIDFIFIKHDLKQGRYEISITDGPGDLYEIKGTDVYIKFNSYYGYAGYGDEGLLIVNSYGRGKFIKFED